jgi:diguanylate cyclase (GGDEF)-like protein
MQQPLTIDRVALQPIVLPIVPHENERDDLLAARSALAEALAVIGAQEERIRHLEDMAMTDELTGLLNRRGFTHALRHEIAFARRDKEAQGMLIMIDLDGFKTINDHYGHAAGDQYLKAVAEALKTCVRDHDFVARPGGDEFALILTRIDKRDSLNRLREIEKIFHSHSAYWQGHALPLRASFGLSAYTGEAPAEDVMAMADLRLYAQKGQRRETKVLMR